MLISVGDQGGGGGECGMADAECGSDGESSRHWLTQEHEVNESKGRASSTHKPWTCAAIEIHRFVLVRRLSAESALLASMIAGKTVSQ